MTKHLVCLTFDFDAISGWVARGFSSPTPVSRGEFGVVGADRILDLLSEYRIRSTWFIPGHTIDTFPEICDRVHREGHEIANHGYMHEAPAMLSREEEERALRRGNDAIRNLTGKDALGYRSPSWDLSPHTVELLLGLGFVYDSSMMANDYFPYRARTGDVIEKDGPVRFGRITDLVEMPVSWSLDDLPHFEYVRYKERLLAGMQNAELVMQNWLDEFTYMRSATDCGVLTYTFHPQVIGRGYRMLMLRKLIDGLLAGGAEFRRVIDVASEFIDNSDGFRTRARA